jgi:serine O-acetyltransferase
LYRADHRYAARFFWQLNLMITGADISAAANLGEGLLILSPPGTAIMGTAGRNLTVMPLGGLGGELGRYEDIGAGPGMPLLGDDVVLEPNSGVMGPVRIGSRVRIRATVAVTKDIPDDVLVMPPEIRVLGRRTP